MADNETTDDVSETEVTTSDERKKRSVIWGYFVVEKDDKSKGNLHDL